MWTSIFASIASGVLTSARNLPESLRREASVPVVPVVVPPLAGHRLYLSDVPRRFGKFTWRPSRSGRASASLTAIPHVLVSSALSTFDMLENMGTVVMDMPGEHAATPT